jgi:hypothetical protein
VGAAGTSDTVGTSVGELVDVGVDAGGALAVGASVTGLQTELVVSQVQSGLSTHVGRSVMPAHAVAGLVVDGIGGNVVIAVGDPPPTDMHMVLVPSHMQPMSAAHDVGSKWSEHGSPTTGGGVAVGDVVGAHDPG